MEKPAIERLKRVVEAVQGTAYVPKVNTIQGEGFWLSPYGEAVRAAPTHIYVVDNHPEKFGLSREEIDKWYAKYGEARGTEGKAREEILRELIRRGWVRIRYYVTRSFQGFSVNVGRDDRRTKNLVTDFFAKLLQADPGLKYSEVLYDSPLDLKKFTVREIAEFALFRGMEEGFNPAGEVTFLLRPADLTPVPF